MNHHENKSLSLEERVERLEKIVLSEGYPSRKSDGVEKLIIDHVDNMSTQHLVVIALFLKSKQTKQEIKNMLQDWGKAIGNWFQGGNMNNRLVKTAIIKKDGVNDKNEDLFSLTGKGENMAKKMISKIKD
ncbi:MAG: hypothetical protein KGI19_08905 [Thaumarchaeota archaeon]|nr:hypothetical protein [Nitrososphaerota archaeon]